MLKVSLTIDFIAVKNFKVAIGEGGFINWMEVKSYFIMLIFGIVHFVIVIVTATGIVTVGTTIMVVVMFIIESFVEHSS